MGPHAYGAGSGQHARDRHHPGKMPGLVDLCPLLQRPPFSTPRAQSADLSVKDTLAITIVHRWSPAAAFVELVGPPPGEAAGGALTFSRAYGLIEGIPAARTCPRDISPS